MDKAQTIDMEPEGMNGAESAILPEGNRIIAAANLEAIGRTVEAGYKAATQDSKGYLAMLPCAELLREIQSFALRKEVNIESALRVEGIKNPTRAQRVGKLLDIILEDVSKESGHPLNMVNGRACYYNGKFWEPVSDFDLGYFMTQAAQALGIEKYEAMYCDFVRKAVDTFQLSTRAQLNVKQPGVSLVNFSNGTLEISDTGETLRPHSYKDGLQYVVNANYDKNAKAPKFRKHLAEWLPEEPDRLNVQEYCGSIFADINHERLMYFYGATGNNGKTTLKDIICGVLGESRVSSVNLSNLTEKGGTGEASRAALEGKLLNACGEIEHEIRDTSLLKQITSREALEVRPPYQKSYTIPAHGYARLLFCCNSLPVIFRGAAKAEARRFLFIEFKNEIPIGKRNGNLAREIVAEELPGIFNWMLEGLKRMKKNGGSFFTKNPHAEAVTETFLEGSNSVIAYLAEYGIIPDTPTNRMRPGVIPERIESAKLFNNSGAMDIDTGQRVSYRTFCSLNNMKAKGRNNFLSSLKQMGFNLKHTNTGNYLDVLTLSPEERYKEKIAGYNPELFQQS